MTAISEPWAFGDAPSDTDSHSETIATLNADIQSLVTSKEIIRIAPVKAAFDSVIAVLTLVSVRFLVPFSLFQPLMDKHDQQETTEESSFVELARLCSRVCHVLDAMTQGRELDRLGDLSLQIEDFRRCVDIARFFLPTITSHTRTVRDIESAVRGQAECDSGLQQDLSSSTVKCITAWRAELSEILSVFDVRCFHHTAAIPKGLQLP